MANSVSRHHHQLTADSQGYVAGIKSAEAATRALQIQQGKAASASQMGSKAASRFGVVAQQAGYQVQDFAVQVQGGQSALVALGQQGSQLLGVFGVGGAIAGAVLTVGTLAIRMAGVGDSTKESKKSAEELKKAYEELDERAGKIAERWEEINKGYSSYSQKKSPFSSSSLEAIRSGLVQGLPGMESDRFTLEGKSAIARARANDTSKSVKERLGFNKQAIEFAEQEAAAQQRILNVRNRILELEDEIKEARTKESASILGPSRSDAVDLRREYREQLDAEAKAIRSQISPMSKLIDMRERLLEMTKYGVLSSEEAARFMDTQISSQPIPAALRANSGASSLGGTAASGDSIINLQKQTLDVQKQILAEQKRLTSFWGNN